MNESYVGEVAEEFVLHVYGFNVDKVLALSALGAHHVTVRVVVPGDRVCSAVAEILDAGQCVEGAVVYLSKYNGKEEVEFTVYSMDLQGCEGENGVRGRLYPHSSSIGQDISKKGEALPALYA